MYFLDLSFPSAFCSTHFSENFGSDFLRARVSVEQSAGEYSKCGRREPQPLLATARVYLSLVGGEKQDE